MKNLLRGACCAIVLATTGWGAEEFSKALTAEEFAGAGLGKLSPEELARLDALVQRQRSGAVAQAREETTVKVREETAAKVKAEMATASAAKPEGDSLLHRLRVKLTPGTEIDYERVETQIAGSFRGYEPGQVLTLSNGQQWRVLEGNYWAPAKTASRPRKVVIESGTFGSFFLSIEDGGRPKVKYVGQVSAEK